MGVRNHGDPAGGDTSRYGNRQLAYLRSPATVDEGANWPVAACATGVQVCAVPRLNKTDEVGTLTLMCGHRKTKLED